MTTWADLAQSVLTSGIDAYSETQVARYQANDPTPNQRGNGNVTGAAGQPIFDTFADTLSNPVNLALIGAAIVLVVVLVRGRR